MYKTKQTKKYNDFWLYPPHFSIACSLPLLSYWLTFPFLSLVPSTLLCQPVVETGDDINTILDEGVLLIANHQSTADVPAMMNVMHSKVKLAKQVMWIIDSTFKYTHFGLVSNLRGDFFIKQVCCLSPLICAVMSFKYKAVII